MMARVSENHVNSPCSSKFWLIRNLYPLILILYNGTNSLASYPIGHYQIK